MLAEAKQVKTAFRNVDGEVDDDGPAIVVYEGFLTQLVQGKCNLSTPYYTSVRRALISMGCIRQLRRGGSTTPSQWEMIYEPTVEAFMRQANADKKPAAQSKDDMHTANIVNLTRRIQELEDTVNEIVTAMATKFGSEEVAS